ncbi:MAG TPA: Ku protein [Lacipirellulaceae bacterium]|nr:Ku protein [Lacipirellulaceae bacterium]
MGRPVWKGHISFGLVSMPVELHSAELRADISFHLVDSRNSARVRYERVNAETGEEVPWDKIVKGYEYADGSYVLLSEEELERASSEMTRTIEIEQFVALEEIDVRYFERPYLVTPGKGGEKGYILLREAARRAGKAGVASVVIRARQHLAALLVVGDALVLELLRYPQELREVDDYDIPGADLRKHKVSPKEIALASQLIEGMSAHWDPTGYHDEYRDVLMEMIEKKIRSGKTEAIEEMEEEEVEEPKTLNFMDVLKRSVEHAQVRKAPKRAARTTPRKTAKKKAAPRKRPTKRQKAS